MTGGQEVTTVTKSKGSMFYPDWFADNSLQGFPLKHIDTKSEHLQNLKHSIRVNGYNEKEPIIIAKSKDPAASGYVIDGRHRLIACDYVFIETGKMPNVKIQSELVKDLAHAQLRQIYYESQHLLKKNSDAAGEHIIELYEDAKKTLPELGKMQSLDDFLGEEAGFGKDSQFRLIAVCNKIQKYALKERQKQQAKMVEPKSTEMRESEREAMKDWVDPRGSGSDAIASTIKTFKEFTSELETTCQCGKRTNHAVSVKLFDDGTTKLEQVT